MENSYFTLYIIIIIIIIIILFLYLHSYYNSFGFWRKIYIMTKMGWTGQVLEPGVHCDFALVYYYYYHFPKRRVSAQCM